MPAKIEKIQLSERQYEKWDDTLSEFFLSKEIPFEDVPDKVKSVLDEAQRGWPRSPRDIETRIKMKSGYKWKSHNNLRSNTDSLPSVQDSDNRRNGAMRELYQWEKSLKPEEKLWWERREAQFRAEFEFNQSSDQPLLFQLLVEELQQQRIAALILKDPKTGDAYSKLSTDSLKRMSDIQTKLGITREQRSDILDNAEGDMSSLSIDFDEKVKKAKLQIVKWQKEEAKRKHTKSIEGVINALPPFEKIEALLGMDPEGNLGANLDTMDISKVLNEATKIHDETLEQIEQEKDDAKDKPQGSINTVGEE